jgi:methyl-accepting chemotaxis protein
MNPPNKRRIVLIDPRFQLRLAAAFILLQVLLTALFAAGFYIFMDSELHADLASAHASYKSLSQILLPIVLTLAVFSVTLSIALTSIFVVLLSHKIAGPLYRFRTILESLSHRRFEAHTRIRPDDQLGEFAVALDKAIKTVKADIHELHQSVWKLRESHAKADSDSFDTQIAAIEKTLDSWEKG